MHFMSMRGEAAETLAKRSLSQKEKGKKAAILGTGNSLEAYNPSKYKDHVKIAIDNSLKIFDADYCICRDYRKANAVSFNAIRRPDTQFILDQEAMDYVYKAPVSTYLFGESIQDRFSKSNPLLWDDFGKCSMAYALELCEEMGIVEIDVYGADFFYYKKKRYAFDLGRDYLSIPDKGTREFKENKFTNVYLDSQVIEIQGILNSGFGITINNKSKESRVSWNAQIA